MRWMGMVGNVGLNEVVQHMHDEDVDVEDDGQSGLERICRIESAKSTVVTTRSLHSNACRTRASMASSVATLSPIRRARLYECETVGT